jgi:basic membrane protein A
VAGNVGLGAAKAVQDADNAAGSHKVNMLWVDTDGCVSAAQYCKYFISSVTKGIQTAVKNAVLSRGQRHVQGRQLHRHAGQRRRGALAVPRLRQQGPAALQAELKTLKTGIENGRSSDGDQEPRVT